MAVRAIAIWEAKPGRAAELIALGAQAKAIHESLGPRARLSLATFAGSWQALAAVIGAAGSPGTLLSNSVLVDVPGILANRGCTTLSRERIARSPRQFHQHSTWEKTIGARLEVESWN